MLPHPARYLFATLLIINALCPLSSYGQNNVWNESAKLSGKAKKTAGKATGTFKKWKQHLQHWGLDSSYNHSLSLGGKLLTNGWSVGLVYEQPRGSYYERRRGKYAGQSKFWSLYFSEIKHEKQVKQQKENSQPELGTSLPFVFGKINNLYLLQLGYGREQVLLPRVVDGNLSVSFRYSGGFSLAMLKPYFLHLMYVTYTPDPVTEIKEERYSENNSELFLNRDRIFGGSRWSTGLDEMRYVPGVFVDAAFVLTPAQHKTFFQTVSFGGQFSAYTKSLLIMADRKAYPFIGSLYVGLCLGKRWR